MKTAAIPDPSPGPARLGKPDKTAGRQDVSAFARVLAANGRAETALPRGAADRSEAVASRPLAETIAADPECVALFPGPGPARDGTKEAVRDGKDSGRALQQAAPDRSRPAKVEDTPSLRRETDRDAAAQVRPLAETIAAEPERTALYPDAGATRDGTRDVMREGETSRPSIQRPAADRDLIPKGGRALPLRTDVDRSDAEPGSLPSVTWTIPAAPAPVAIRADAGPTGGGIREAARDGANRKAEVAQPASGRDVPADSSLRASLRSQVPQPEMPAGPAEPAEFVDLLHARGRTVALEVGSRTRLAGRDERFSPGPASHRSAAFGADLAEVTAGEAAWEDLAEAPDFAAVIADALRTVRGAGPATRQPKDDADPDATTIDEAPGAQETADENRPDALEALGIAAVLVPPTPVHAADEVAANEAPAYELRPASLAETGSAAASPLAPAPSEATDASPETPRTTPAAAVRRTESRAPAPAAVREDSALSAQITIATARYAVPTRPENASVDEGLADVQVLSPADPMPDAPVIGSRLSARLSERSLSLDLAQSRSLPEQAPTATANTRAILDDVRQVVPQAPQPRSVEAAAIRAPATADRSDAKAAAAEAAVSGEPASPDAEAANRQAPPVDLPPRRDDAREGRDPDSRDRSGPRTVPAQPAAGPQASLPAPVAPPVSTAEMPSPAAILADAIAAEPSWRPAPVASTTQLATYRGPTSPRTLHIQLNPGHLGPVRATLAMSGTQLEIAISVENHEALERLQGERHVIENALRALGYETAQVSITQSVIASLPSVPGDAPAAPTPSGNGASSQQADSNASSGGNRSNGQQADRAQESSSQHGTPAPRGVAGDHRGLYI